MGYTWLIKQKEGIGMETTFYTISANEIVVAGDGVEQVSGGEGRRVVCLRRSAPKPAPGKGKVISLDAWRAEHEAEEWEEEFRPEEEPEEKAAAPAARPRTDHRRERGLYLDWLVSLTLIAVAAAACVSFLL